MSDLSRGSCVYCGLPRARVRAFAGGLYEVPACVAHVDLLGLDPSYDLAGAIAASSPSPLDYLARAPASLFLSRTPTPAAMPP